MKTFKNIYPNIITSYLKVQRCYLSLCSDRKMTDMASGTQVGAMVGMLDVVVIGSVAAVALYFFVLRKKKDEVPDVKKLTVV